MKVLIDCIRLLTLKTYYQYVNSAIHTYIEMVLPTVNICSENQAVKIDFNNQKIINPLHSSKQSLIFAPQNKNHRSHFGDYQGIQQKPQ